METAQKVRTIELGCDSDPAFAEWLQNRGYNAYLGNTTETWIDGVLAKNEEELRELSETLWNDFCRSWR